MTDQPMKLFGWKADGGALSRIRVEIPFAELDRRGVAWARHGQIFDPRYGDADTLVGVRIATPEPTKLWPRACGMLDGPFCVFECDDDVLNISAFNMGLVRQFWGNPIHRWCFTANIRVAHRVVTSTAHLANRLYDQFGHPDIVIAPTTVPDWLLDDPVDQSPGPNGEVVVGWAGGASHRGDWDWCRSGIRRGVRSVPSVRFHCMGVDYGRSLGLKASHYRYTDWFETVDDFWRSLDFQVALAPLRPEAFNRSKSPLKALEAGARGIPVVAQNYGPYAEFVRDGVTGFLVDSNKDWAEAIKVLVTDHDLRATMGAAAREHARSHTVSAVWKRYLEAYTP